MLFRSIRAICVLTVLLTVCCYVNMADAQDFVIDRLVAVYTLMLTEGVLSLNRKK